MIKYTSPTFGELTEKEWLITNGLGGYASSTISGANTRRYHGLFVPALRPPAERTVLVSKIEESIMLPDKERIELGSNQYPGAIHPNGYQSISSFERKPFPSTTFSGDGFKLSKTIFMVHQSNTTIVVYQNLGKEILRLELDPRFVARDYHALFHQESRFDFYRSQHSLDTVAVYPSFGAMPFYIECPGSTFHAGGTWYKNITYSKETYRGLDDQEDAYSHGQYLLELRPGQKGYMLFTLDEDQLHQDLEKTWKKEIARLKSVVQHGDTDFSIELPKQTRQFYDDVLVAGEQFLVKRSGNNGQTIIAGYPWFTDWGRDTMIAMRGLVIAGRYQTVAKNIIRTFLSYLKDGLIPNRFPDHGEMPEYNTIDASLWMFIVLYEYVQKFRDREFVVECLPALQSILNAYKNGTHYRIHMTPEGLIFGGEGLSQLTWMDAKVGDLVVTPRHGCPVEINALWYNAICIFNEFSQLTKSSGAEWQHMENQVRDSFRAHFMNQKGYLNDVVIPCEYADDSFRPNQLYAISLPFPLLTGTESELLLEKVYEKLWTPLGIRSLSADHPDFIEVYGGDQWHRDRAYHQGTVWSYLMGEYLLAFLKTKKYSTAAKKKVLTLLSGLQEHFYNSDCLHGISEIFDGLNPGAGRGCVHQAWSAGMLLLVFDALKEQSSAEVPVRVRKAKAGLNA